MSVLLPSSTEPAVAMRRMSLRAIAMSCACSAAAEWSRPALRREASEVPLLLPVFHGGVADLVVAAGGAALGHPGHRDLGDDLLDVRGLRQHRGGQVGVADGAIADRLAARLLTVARADELVDRVEHPLPLDYLALLRQVERRDLDLLAEDVLPDVQLGPVRQREDPDRLAEVDPAIEEVPELGALVLRVPLAELVAEGEDALLGAGLVLVAAGAAGGGGGGGVAHPRPP